MTISAIRYRDQATALAMLTYRRRFDTDGRPDGSEASCPVADALYADARHRMRLADEATNRERDRILLEWWES